MGSNPAGRDRNMKGLHHAAPSLFPPLSRNLLRERRDVVCSSGGHRAVDPGPRRGHAHDIHLIGDPTRATRFTSPKASRGCSGHAEDVHSYSAARSSGVKGPELQHRLSNGVRDRSVRLPRRSNLTGPLEARAVGRDQLRHWWGPEEGSQGRALQNRRLRSPRRRLRRLQRDGLPPPA